MTGRRQSANGDRFRRRFTFGRIFDWTTRPVARGVGVSCSARFDGRGRLGVAVCLLALLWPVAAVAQAAAQANASTEGTSDRFPNHVIFLIDTSGSVYRRNGLSDLRWLLHTKLDPLLSDGAKNGFGVPVYDPGKDYSTAMGFGLVRELPVFDPESENSFFRVLWVQAPGRSYDDLASSLPNRHRYWTVFNAAFGSAVRQLAHEVESRKIEQHTFKNTFLVLVTDGVRSASKGIQDEIQEIHDVATNPKTGDPALKPLLVEDRRRANVFFQQLGAYYSLLPPEDLKVLAGVQLGASRFKVFFRQLVPHRQVSLDGLLDRRPDQVNTLKRLSAGRYAGELQLQLDAEVSGAYELQLAEGRAPGSTSFVDLAVEGAGRIDLPPVDLARGEVDDAELAYRLHFRRTDPVYGQALVTFEETVKFQTGPTEKILGLLPVTDWRMSLTPWLSQAQIAVCDTWIAFALMVVLLYWLFFPRPKAAIEWADKDGSSRPIPIDFSLMRSGGELAHPVVLRTLRFTNQRLRWKAQRQFKAQITVDVEPLPDVIVDGLPVGLSANMDSVKDFPRLTDGTELTIGLQPDAFQDYIGASDQKVHCRLNVKGTQRKEGLWARLGSPTRKLNSLCKDFHLEFLPEEAAVEARLVAGANDHDSSDTREAAFPDDERISDSLVTPHKLQDEAAANGVLVLKVRSSARRVCSRTLSARVKTVMYRANRSRVLHDDAVKLGKLANGASGTCALEWAGNDDLPPWKLSGITPDPKRDWPISIPLILDFEHIPLPPLVGDDYIVEVHLYPDDEQEWPVVTSSHRLRIDPDPRHAGLQLEVAASHYISKDGKKLLDWRAIDPRGDATLEVDSPAPWSVGRDKGFATLARFRIDNLARNGKGEMTLRLDPNVAIKSGEQADEDLEPDYRNGPLGMLELQDELRDDGYNLAELTTPIEWSIANTSVERPIELDLLFDAHGIVKFDRKVRSYPYVVTLPFTCQVRESIGDAVKERSFKLRLSFKVLRHVGDHVLAIDFGTSTVVSAFEEAMENIDLRGSTFSAATLDLQSRYHEVLADRDRRIGKRIHVASEQKLPNLERDTRFMPSHVVWRVKKKAGDADFVDLPATLGRLVQHPSRAVHYLKGLILRGDERLPKFGEDSASEEWIDDDDQLCSDQPLVDDVLSSAYRSLLTDYLEPILAREGKEELLDKLVFAHPNNFSLGHKERLNRVLIQAFGQRFRIDFLSESNAVAIYCSYPRERFLPPKTARENSQTLLVYDIGAGTLDLTLTRLEWSNQDQAHALERMAVLFQSGFPVAGNRLDIALARVIDSKVRQLEGTLAKHGIQLNYMAPIVDPPRDKFDLPVYRHRMAHVKLAIQQLKLDLTEQTRTGSDRFTLHVPLDAMPGMGVLSFVSLKPDETERILKAHAIHTKTRKEAGDLIESKILVPLTSEEIYNHPAIESWLSMVTDEVIADLAGGLNELRIKLSIDALILSGRTMLFPPLRQRLLSALENHLGLDPKSVHVPEFSATELKEAVALGSLYYGLLFRQGVQFEDRSVWARYGVIYNTGEGPRFKEFFGYTTSTDVLEGDLEINKDGHRLVLFRRRKTIVRAGGPMKIAITFSPDPNRDLQDPFARSDKFTVLRSLGNAILGDDKRVTIEMAIDKQSHLNVLINPDVLPRKVKNISYLEHEHLPQLDWPYSPLTDITGMPGSDGEPVLPQRSMPVGLKASDGSPRGGVRGQSRSADPAESDLHNPEDLNFDAPWTSSGKDEFVEETSLNEQARSDEAEAVPSADTK